MSNPANEHHVHYVLRQCGPAWLAVDPDIADEAIDAVADSELTAEEDQAHASAVRDTRLQRVTRRWRDAH